MQRIFEGLPFKMMIRAADQGFEPGKYCRFRYFHQLEQFRGLGLAQNIVVGSLPVRMIHRHQGILIGALAVLAAAR